MYTELELVRFLRNAAMNDPSALLAHEAAFCLGQMQDEKAVLALQQCLKNAEIHAMVRHEVSVSFRDPDLCSGTNKCICMIHRAMRTSPETGCRGVKTLREPRESRTLMFWVLP